MNEFQIILNSKNDSRCKEKKMPVTKNCIPVHAERVVMTCTRTIKVGMQTKTKAKTKTKRNGTERNGTERNKTEQNEIELQPAANALHLTVFYLILP